MYVSKATSISIFAFVDVSFQVGDKCTIEMISFIMININKWNNVTFRGIF